MSTTFYSTQNTVTGASSSYVRAKCVYSTSSTDTTFTISGTIYLQHMGAAVTASTVQSAEAVLNSSTHTEIFTTKQTSTVTTFAKHSSWTDVVSASFSGTATRTSSAGSVTLKIGSGWIPIVDLNSAVKEITIPSFPTYTISYNANGGSGAPSSQTKTYGTALKLSSTKPTRTNYVFKNWNTKSDGTGTSYNPGASYTANATATLYAQWYAPYTVTPNANGGTLASGCSALTKVYNTALTLWASSKNPTRTGYTFSKWNTKQDGSGTAYSAGASYTANASATLYAQWTANKYTISFNANGGVSAPSSVTKTYGQSVTLPTAKPTRIGHTFLGWAETSGATKAKWAAGATFSDAITANKTLYAVWRDDYTSPQITSLTVYRCDSEGNEDDEGSYASIRAVWSVDTSVDEGMTNSGTVTGTIAEEGGSQVPFAFSSGDTGVSGTAVAMVSGLDTDIQYTVRVTVTDVRGASKATTRTALILRAFYIMDFGNAGQSVGIGRAASNLGLEVGYKTIFDDDVTMYQDLSVDGDISSEGEVSATDSGSTVHNLTEKVDKSGDTMTNTLTINKASPYFGAKDTGDCSYADNNVTANHYPGFRALDALARIVAAFEGTLYTTGDTRAGFYVRNYADSSTSYAGHKGMSIKMDKQGNATWVVDEPAGFRSAIGVGAVGTKDSLAASDIPSLAISKITNLQTSLDGKMSDAGDTATGIYHFKSSNIDRDGADPSSDTTGNSYITLQDKNGEDVGRIDTVRRSSGRQDLRLFSYNENSGSQVQNYIQICIAKDGTQSYSVGSPANFRSAIGVNAPLKCVKYTSANGKHQGNKTFTHTAPTGYTLLVTTPLGAFVSGAEGTYIADRSASQSGTTVTVTVYVANPNAATVNVGYVLLYMKTGL